MASREEIQERVDIMQAWLNGKNIEFRDLGYSGSWARADTPVFKFHQREYRIKPEPREVYLNEGADGILDFWMHAGVARAQATAEHVRVAVHYREVMEDE